MPLTARLAQEELVLRSDLRNAWDKGGERAIRRVLAKNWDVAPQVIDRVATFLIRQNEAAPIPVASPMQVELVKEGRSLLIHFHVVAGRAVNRSLAWVVAHRLGIEGSVVANHDDHAFLLVVSQKNAPGEAEMRMAFNPQNWRSDLQRILQGTEMLGRSFRPVAETGQLIPRRTYRGPTAKKSSSWNATLLYTTLQKHEPDHPLLREAVREAMEDQMDVEHSEQEAARIFESPWEIFELPRPSPFALPLFAAFSRETLLAQDPEKALDELVASLYDEWSHVEQVV
jgi:ATP-dependent Lhr-like helicase